MTVRIPLDLNTLHLVVDGRRHRSKLDHVPAPDETVVMLCGLADSVSYTTAHEPGVRTCWPCDLRYRRDCGLPVPPTHPGVQNGRKSG